MHAEQPEPLDPDVTPDEAQPLHRAGGDVLAAIALGGGLGAAARWEAGRIWPSAVDGIPWATLAVNVIGAGLIGVLMVLVTERWTTHHLVRPFLGVGVLGGFTTFSTYAADTWLLLDHGQPLRALAYVALSLVLGLAAAVASMSLTRAVVEAR